MKGREIFDNLRGEKDRRKRQFRNSNG